MLGRLLILLGDPVNRCIVEALLAGGGATSGELATRMQSRFGIGRSATSTHITQLEIALLLVRGIDGANRLIDPHGLDVFLSEGHRVASTAIGSAALTTEALRAHYEGHRQTRDVSRPDISTFFSGPRDGPSFNTDGVIQRPAATRVPQAHALSSEGWKLDIVWVASDVTETVGGSLRHSVPARYYPPRAHLLVINADWPPLVRAIERRAPERSRAASWDAACALMEREAVDALGLAVRRRLLDSDDLDDVLHDHLVERLPVVEQRLADVLQRRGL